MSDDRPSIAELEAAHARDTFTDEALLIEATPVLLGIAKTALAWAEQERKADRATCVAAAAPLAGNVPDWNAAGVENERLDQCRGNLAVALAKVRR